jgi:hypothetical protein
MAFNINPLVTKIINGIEKANVIYNRAKDLDLRYLYPEYWKIDKFNNLINTWCIFTTIDLGGSPLTTPIVSSVAATSLQAVNTVTVFGVNISVNKSPKIIETNVKGFSSPVYQFYKQDTYEISIDFLETGPVFFQQNSNNIRRLIKVLDKPQTIDIISPQLQLIYGIKKVVVKSYSIGQDERFYTHNPISIQLKSDNGVDLLTPSVGI